MSILSNEEVSHIEQATLATTDGEWVQWKDHATVYVVEPGSVKTNTALAFGAQKIRPLAHSSDASDADQFWKEGQPKGLDERLAEEHGLRNAAFIAKSKGWVLSLVESVREARGLYSGLLKQIKDAPVQVVYCVYCGHEYPAGTPQAKAKVLTDHIMQCEKHPMKVLVEMAEALERWESSKTVEASQEDFKQVIHALERWRRTRR